MNPTERNIYDQGERAAELMICYHKLTERLNDFQKTDGNNYAYSVAEILHGLRGLFEITNIQNILETSITAGAEIVGRKIPYSVAQMYEREKSRLVGDGQTDKCRHYHETRTETLKNG